MSIYDQRTRAGNPRNPAKALYSYWYSVLKHLWVLDGTGRPTGAFQFGRDRNYGIGPFSVYTSHNYTEAEIGSNKYPHISWGTAWWGSSVGNTIILTRDGEFRLQGFHGYESRNRLARNTFLDWDRHRSEYQWFVNLSHEQTRKNYGAGDSTLLKAWRHPVHYVRERLLTPEYVIPPYWMKLQRDTNFVGGWKIAFSRMSDMPPNTYHLKDVDIPARFERYEELRLKRLRQDRERDLIISGELVQVGRNYRPKAEIEQRKEEQALALAAHLSVSMPARTTPLQPLRRR